MTTKTLEINQSNEWLQVFSAIDFALVAEEDRDNAADSFTEHLVIGLESAGFDTKMAQGQRSTCHGWNGANTFRRKLGPVGSFSALSDIEVEAIYVAIERAECAMCRDWLQRGDWPSE